MRVHSAREFVSLILLNGLLLFPACAQHLPPGPQMEGFTNTIGMKLVLIPAGEFRMGSPDSDPDARDYEKPQHRVKISRPFWLGVYEVTQGQYRAVTGKNPSYRGTGDSLPVEAVTWFQAIEFCNNLSVKERLEPYYRIEEMGDNRTVLIADRNGTGYRLPTEAEWEYACRAGTSTTFGFGAGKRLEDHAWFVDNAWSETHPVGQKLPNAFGLYDMHGNVKELCWDGYDWRYYKTSPMADPLGPSQFAERVVRGGCLYSYPVACRSAFRYSYEPGIRSLEIGFRVARGLSVPESRAEKVSGTTITNHH